MGGSKSVVVGYKYYAGIHFVLVHGPIDRITEIKVDDRTAWDGLCTGGRLSIDSPDLFGGSGREGGIVGDVDIMMGGKSQGKNDYLESKLGSDIPAYRGVVSVILRQVYIGLNPYLKPWKFRARRILTSSRGATQWYSSKAAIGQDMNPAHIIRECLTNPDWGMGYGDGDVDENSFKAAANTLYSESFGLSFLWSKEAPIEDFITDVVKHIDAALFVDRTTGKFKLKLVRKDYNVDDLLVLNEDNVEKVDDFTSAAMAELVNSVTVNYWDESTGNDSSLTAQDLSLISSQGATINATQTYSGITNGTLASKVAARDLRVMSNPLLRCTIVANRTAASLNVGDAFVLDWPDYGVSGLVMRVGVITLGDALDGAVRIGAVQDVFGIPDVIFVPPSPVEWSDPISAPANMTRRFIVEAPYYVLVKQGSQSTVDSSLATEPLAGYIMATGVRPSSDAINAKLSVNSGGGYYTRSTIDFCPAALLSVGIGPTTTSITVKSGVDLDLLSAGTLAQIGNEIISINTIAGNTLTIGRGVLDTVPTSHLADSSIYFWDGFSGSDNVEYVSGEDIGVRMLPSTGKGTLAFSSASESTLEMANRAIRPYPPGQWKISGSYFPTEIIDVALTASWVHRDRTQQTGSTTLDFFSGSVGPESGTTYSIRLYNNTTGTLLHSVDSVSGSSYTFPAYTGRYTLRMELWAVRSGYASLQKHSHVFSYINVTFINTQDSYRLITEGGDLMTTE